MLEIMEQDGDVSQDGDNQPEMTREEAVSNAMKFARDCGKAVAKGEMSMMGFVEKLLPLAHVLKQLIKADDAKDLWVENATARNNALSLPHKDAVNPKGNSKAANGSKIRQAIKLANTVDYAEDLLQDVMDEIARLRAAGEKTASPYPGFIDVCRHQLKNTDNRLTPEEISKIVCPDQKPSTELKKLEVAVAALKAASKLREEAGEPVNPQMERVQSEIEDRIAVIKQLALQAKARAAAQAAGLIVI
jgi:hypothetical protein